MAHPPASMRLYKAGFTPPDVPLSNTTYLTSQEPDSLKTTHPLRPYSLALTYRASLMLTKALTLITVLTSLVATHATPVAKRYYPQGTISSPANGTVILPGESFDFSYNPRGDYCLSSYNITVWLLTSAPSSILDGSATGHYFGRYAYSSYPTNPYPTNPAPSTLTLPDFSQRPGGFGDGASATNQTMYLAVIEEYDDCSPHLGQQFALAANSIVYNGTST